MAKSSFHTINATKNSLKHMMRKQKVTYLLDNNSIDNEYYSSGINIQNFIAQAQESYRKRVKQNMQKSQLDALIKEAAINIKKDTNINDVFNLFISLRKVFGGYEIFDAALHKDEGVFVEWIGKKAEEWNVENYIYDSINFKWYDKNNKEVTEHIIAHRPNRDIFYNEDDGNWYTTKTFEAKFDMSILQKFENMHAHVIYSTFDLDTGEGRTNRADMRKVQTITAEALNMDRGKEGSNTMRGSHWHRKQITDAVNDAKKDHSATITLLKEEIKNSKKEKAEAEEAWKARAKRIRLKLQSEKTKRPQYLLHESQIMELEERIQTNTLNYANAELELEAIWENIIFDMQTEMEKSEFKVVKLEKEVLTLTTSIAEKDSLIDFTKDLLQEKSEQIELLEEEIESAVKTNEDIKSINDKNVEVVNQAQGIINERNKELKATKVLTEGETEHKPSTSQENSELLKALTNFLKKIGASSSTFIKLFGDSDKEQSNDNIVDKSLKDIAFKKEKNNFINKAMNAIKKL